MERDYTNLHRGLVVKYFWQVIRKFKVPFFTVVVMTILASALDIFIPLQYLNLWNVLSNNNFTAVAVAKNLILLILGLNFIRWAFRRISGFSLAYFEAEVLAGLRKQAFSYLIGHSHSFFANNFAGSLTQRINKYARAFEKITDRMIADGLPLIVRGVGTVIAIYTLFPKYSYILGVFCLVFLLTAFIYIRYKLKYDVIASEADSRTTGAVSDSIGNHASIQLFTGHDHERLRVGEVMDDQRNKTKFNWYLWDGLGAIEAFYAIVIEFVIFWVVIGDWKLGLISLPVIVLLQNYLIRLIENLWSFAA
ncbi:MAG: ABC transporter transmembrane domain-containing protein, partial [Candidatus Parcubacteria bacterium]|nr:ABC transporter transmembrane domain-containing protein [Candidatus Parcubacteria bacterium]